jgi:23S rRNA pseudouridine1911/1915/1917 synthase
MNRLKIKDSFKQKNQKPSGETNLKLVVTEPMTLMDFLIAQLPHKNRNNIKTLLKNKAILVNGKPISQFNHPLLSGQIITLNPWYSKPEASTIMEGISILYEDNDIIAIHKESGILSMATDTDKVETAYSMLRNHVKNQNEMGKIFIVHRLDRDTSGVMIFAKNIESKNTLQISWNNTVIQRTYIAVVEGSVQEQSGTITSYLKEDAAYRMHSSQNPNGGEYAITHFKTLKRNKDYSLLEVALETGKKNQIRVHLQDIGHSIVGDKKYGAKTSFLKRLGLHAAVIEFVHPTTKQILKFESDVPKQFTRLF